MFVKGVHPTVPALSNKSVARVCFVHHRNVLLTLKKDFVIGPQAQVAPPISLSTTLNHRQHEPETCLGPHTHCATVMPVSGDSLYAARGAAIPICRLLLIVFWSACGQAGNQRRAAHEATPPVSQTTRKNAIVYSVRQSSPSQPRRWLLTTSSLEYR